MYSSDLLSLSTRILDWSKRHGFAEDKVNVDQKLLLIVGEISEAHDEMRSGKSVSEIYRESNGKPAGFPIELADTIIRILDLAAQLNLDMGEAVRMKMDYNETRPYKHGRKF